jgi:hypothetical protein
MAELVVACGSGLRAAALSVGGATNYFLFGDDDING